jgi:F-type H+-transporting ATPase subunit delta
MANEKLARRYTTAVFSLANEAAAVDTIGNDLATAASAIGADPALAAFFAAPIVPRPEKERALIGAFSGRLHDVALHSLLLLVRKRRETLLQAMVEEYRKLQLAQRGEEPLTVTSARELPRRELDALVARLERLHDKKFQVTQVVDPALIGGVRVLMGDRRLDGSVAGRLDALSRTLFANN